MVGYSKLELAHISTFGVCRALVMRISKDGRAHKNLLMPGSFS